MSGLTVNVLDELSDPMGVDVAVSPEKEAVKVYEFDASLGVMVQLANRWYSSSRYRTRNR